MHLQVDLTQFFSCAGTKEERDVFDGAVKKLQNGGDHGNDGNESSDDETPDVVLPVVMKFEEVRPQSFPSQWILCFISGITK